MRHFVLSLMVVLSLNLRDIYALSVEMVDQLDIKAIKSINLKKTDEEFRAEVVVQFSTSATAAVKFKEADFVIIFQDGQGEKIHLGTAKPKEIIFPASEDGIEHLKDEKLDVYVGKNDINTITRLIKLFNLIGNPDSEFAMILSGSTEVGTKAKRGWIYQGRVELEDFTFHPTIQREVLFK